MDANEALISVAWELDRLNQYWVDHDRLERELESHGALPPDMADPPGRPPKLSELTPNLSQHFDLEDDGGRQCLEATLKALYACSIWLQGEPYDRRNLLLGGKDGPLWGIVEIDNCPVLWLIDDSNANALYSGAKWMEMIRGQIPEEIAEIAWSALQSVHRQRMVGHDNLGG